jgi:beta-lactamase class A
MAMFRNIDAFDGVLGIYAENLSTGKSVRFSSTDSFYLASVTKVGVMAHLYRRFDAGVLQPTSKRTFTEGFYREEKKTLRHADIGARYTLDEYAEFMIDDSDTTSTDILVDHVGAANINQTIRSLNLGSFGDITSIATLDKNIWARVDVRFASEPDHVFEDWLRNDPEFYQLSFSPDFSETQRVDAHNAYYATGLNSASPQAIESLVELMAREQLWSESASEDMLDKLRLNPRPKFGSKLPKNVRCGSKGGDKFQVATEVGFIENASGTPIIAWAILGNEVTASDDEVSETYGELGRLIYNAIK